ncbi:helix-turn-helix domain-containing protein [Rufibacter aurantiacus]|uniref:helix-turn-helix domain-containing protein n=1 Tax=Rufibacter aurantiacus TaxID=2817374 RepID=UPI001B30D71F|nr:helix-turn-helix transcriptional regulator [Rufibacter aurantiacus]
MQSFGEFVRDLRREKGLTLTQLAAQLEIDSANLSKIENGKREYDEKRLPLLCNIFNLDLAQMKKELLSEKFAKKAYEDHLDTGVFLLAEKKAKYMTESNSKQTSLEF